MKKPHTLVYILLFIINLIIGLSFFGDLGSGSELGGSLERLGKKIHMVFYAALFSVIVYGLNNLISKIIQQLYLQYFLYVFISGISIYLYYKDCYNQVKPVKQYMSSDEYIELQRSEVKRIKAEVSLKTQKMIVFTPHDSVLNRDKIEILKIVKSEWDNFYSPLMKEQPSSSKLLSRINELMALNYSSIESDSIIEKYKRTLEVNYMLYGPGFHNFIAVLTYDGNDRATDKYSHIILLCNKIHSKVYAYAFTEHNQSGYDTGFSRELVLLKGIQKIFYYEGVEKYGFGKYLLKLKKDENPPSIYFWTSKGLRDLFKYKKDSLMQYTELKDSVSKMNNKWDLPVIVYTN